MTALEASDHSARPVWRPKNRPGSLGMSLNEEHCLLLQNVCLPDDALAYSAVLDGVHRGELGVARSITAQYQGISIKWHKWQFSVNYCSPWRKFLNYETAAKCGPKGENYRKFLHVCQERSCLVGVEMQTEQETKDFARVTVKFFLNKCKFSSMIWLIARKLKMLIELFEQPWCQFSPCYCHLSTLKSLKVDQ